MSENKTIKQKRRGRRPSDENDTRENIIKASLKIFAEYGFNDASIRKIANQAGVDSALLYHYFASKEALFIEAVKSKLIVPQKNSNFLIPESPNQRAKRITTMFLDRFNDSIDSSTYHALISSSLQNKEAAKLLKTVFENQLVSHVATQFDKESAQLRVSVSVSILFGINFLRSILKFEPLNSMSNEEIGSILAPILSPLLSKENPFKTKNSTE